MSLLGNILWIVIGGGIVIFIEYILSGIALCLTIIGIPFGIQCIKLSFLGLLPVGKKIQENRKSNEGFSLIMNVIWILIGGFWIALTHLLFAIVLAITIIGLPFAKQHMKLASLALTPFGKRVS